MDSDSKSKSNLNLLQSLFDEADEEEEEEQQLLAVVLSAVPLIFDKRERAIIFQMPSRLVNTCV